LAGRRHLEIERQERVAEIKPIFQHQAPAAGALRRTGPRDPRKLRLLERQPGGTSGRYTDSINVAVENVVELAPAGARRGTGVIDDQVVEFNRVMRVGKIGFTEHYRISRGIGVDEKTSLFLKVEAPGRAAGRAAATLDL